MSEWINIHSIGAATAAVSNNMDVEVMIDGIWIPFEELENTLLFRARQRNTDEHEHDCNLHYHARAKCTCKCDDFERDKEISKLDAENKQLREYIKGMKINAQTIVYLAESEIVEAKK